MTWQNNKNNMGPPIPIHSSHMHFDPMYQFPISGGAYVALRKTMTLVLSFVIDRLREANSCVRKRKVVETID